MVSEKARTTKPGAVLHAAIDTHQYMPPPGGPRPSSRRFRGEMAPTQIKATIRRPEGVCDTLSFILGSLIWNPP
jgi:hypothetical protein